MPRSYTPFQVDSQIHERVSALRSRISDLAFQKDNRIGLGAAIGMLLDHWEKVPPDVDWLRQQARLYPQRGRPRKSEEHRQRVYAQGRLDPDKGHVFVSPRARPDIRACKLCCYAYNTSDIYGGATHNCPSVDPSSPLQRGTWPKSELIARMFAADEVEWGADG